MKEFCEIKQYSADDIRRIRSDCSMTQSELAEYLGVTVRSVAGWESGKQSASGPVCRLLSLLTPDGDIQNGRILLLKEKAAKHYLHRRRFSSAKIHGKATWIDENGTLYVKFSDEGKTILLPMAQRFRENGDESKYWNVFGRWRIEDYFADKKMNETAEGLKNGNRIYTEAR